jgi:hypothetical protein
VYVVLNHNEPGPKGPMPHGKGLKNTLPVVDNVKETYFVTLLLNSWREGEKGKGGRGMMIEGGDGGMEIEEARDLTNPL